MLQKITQSNSQTEQQVITPDIKLDEGLKAELLSQIQEESMVVVHSIYTAVDEIGIRIWNTTDLIDQHSGKRSRMLDAFGITVAPTWMLVEAGTTVDKTDHLTTFRRFWLTILTY